MDLERYSDIAKNHSAMKKNDRTVGILMKIYIFTCIPYALISVFMIILTVKSDTLMTFIDGVIVKGAVLALGYLGCYRHDFRLPFAALVPQLFSTLAFSGRTYFDAFFGIVGVDINGLLLFGFIGCAVVNMLCCRKYAYLETQPGFPTFSEQFEEQKEKRRKFEENDPFEERRKQLSANSSSEMNELDFTSRMTDNGSADQRSSGTMDEI